MTVDSQNVYGAMLRPENSKNAAALTTGAPNDPDLADLIRTWPALLAAMKAGILSMAKAAGAN